MFIINKFTNIIFPNYYKNNNLIAIVLGSINSYYGLFPRHPAGPPSSNGYLASTAKEVKHGLGIVLVTFLYLFTVRSK